MPAPPIDPGFWHGRRVLMTGHTGFKGAWLALWLQRLGAEVIGFGSRIRATPAPGSLFASARVADGLAAHLDGDVRDSAKVDAAVRCARPEVVFHLAAVANVRRGLRDPAETYATNVMGTVHVLDAVRRVGDDVRAVVCTTSDKVYENREWEWPYRESEPLGGRDPYSSSKACQELVTSAFRDSLLARRGVAVATVRAGNVIGGGDWAPDRLVPDFVRAAIAGAPLHVRSPASVRPWQHVLNPLCGYLLLAEGLCGARAPSLATAFNFGPADDDRRPVRWVVERLCDGWPGEVVARFGDGEAQEAGIVRLDSSRAREALGWAPRWDLAAGVEATVDWYARRHEGEEARALCDAQIDAFAAQAASASDGAAPRAAATRL